MQNQRILTILFTRQLVSSQWQLVEGRLMFRSCRLSLSCLTVCYKRNKREAVGLPVLTGASCGRSRHMGLCLIGLLRSKKSRVSACGSVCYPAQALDCVLFRVFSLSPLIVRDDFLYRIWTARFAHSRCCFVLSGSTQKRGTKLSSKVLCFASVSLDFQFRINLIVSSIFRFEVSLYRFGVKLFLPDYSRPI